MHIRQAHKKILTLLLLGVVLVLPVLAVPEKVVAQADAPPIIANDFVLFNMERNIDVAKEVKSKAEMGVVGTIFTSVVNLLTFAANRLAYDAAVMLASGGPDDQSLIEPRTAETYFADYTSAVAGQAVGLINENLETAGGVFSNFNLCAPTNPEITLAFKLGIRSVFQRPEPLCEFSEIKDNWEGFIAEVASDAEDGIFKNELILTQLKDAFDPQTQEFSVGIQLYSDILGKSQMNAELMTQKLLLQGPTKDVVDVITGNVKTPSELIKNDYLKKDAQLSEVPLQLAYAALSNKEALLQIGVGAASMFTNTLLSALTSKLYSGLFDFDTVNTNPFDEGFSSSYTREDAQKRFSGLLAVTPLSVTDYDVLSQFGSCPRDNRGLYNCVIDSSFISAVARSEAGVPMTVSEAIDEGLIDGGWPLIPSEDAARDQDPYCYTYGFCHSNLVKLRKARIISVGWELAAESTSNAAENPVTLQEVIDGYDSCNTAGELDDNHPWCKLVDPNWVLKYPETQCKALVYGQLLETSAAATRQQECVDMPSCIAEDDNGTCTGGFGYCVAEKNTWDFRGDSCPVYAASCLAFEDMAGDTQSFLLNTVDYGSCDEGSAGCLWYATEKEAGADDTFAWPTVDDVAAEDAADDVYKNRIYLTAAVEECDEADGGCAELNERTSDLSLNMVPNPSFEEDDDEDGAPDSWLLADDTVSTYDATNTYARSGDAAFSPGTSLAYQEGLMIEQGTTYTLSYYARQLDGAMGGDANVILAFTNEDDSTEAIDLNGLAASDGCAISSLGDSIMAVDGTPEDEVYERFTCTLTSPILADRSHQMLAYLDVMAGSVWVDDIQLEQSDEVTDYHEGYSESASTVVAKVAPQYLGCTGASTDSAECDSYAQVCSESQVGCTQYSPSNGDPDVFGVTDETDECPSTCVGYDTFKQEATLYEPDGDFPVYFIPDSADSCSASAVGCDEFTKLDDESLAYFTYVRACLTGTQAEANTNGDQDATFYTWEGSDLDGYQLKTWVLLESDMDAYTTINYTNSGDAEVNPGNAPCTSWTTSEDGVTCNDDVLATIGNFDTDTEDCDEHDDIFENPDCREFYDTAGDIHYREWSLTVTVNDACTSYRKTDLVGLDVDSDGDGVTDDLLADSNCTESGGYFDETLATCRYYGYSEESTTCSESASGCREYTGGRSRNSRLVLEEQFEDGDLTAWEATSATDVTYSNESVATDGHSLSSDGGTVWSYLYDHDAECAETTDGEGCASTTGTLGGDCTVDDGDQFCGTLAGELYAGKTYTLSFWAKGSGDIDVGFDVGADTTNIEISSADTSFGTVTLSASGWEEYQLGPLNITEDIAFGDDTVLVFAPDAGVQFYVDNIVLREGEDNITVIKDSWVTPAECDEAADGTSSPQYYLGCAEYTTQEADTAYLKSFSSLCDEDVVGCAAYFATHESESPFTAVFGATCSAIEDTSVPSDGVADAVDVATDCYKLTLSAGSQLYDTDSPYLCTIGVGETSCAFDLDGYIPTSSFDDAAYLMSHISYGPSAHIVPSDTPKFLVVDSEDECESSAAGCTELGLPTFSSDRQTIAESTSVYLMNTPEDYSDILCASDDLFCAEWDAGESGTYYFKDPQDQTCEYQTDVTVNGATYDGWFRAGTSDFCYGTCSSGGNACSSDADCGSGDSCDVTDGSYVIDGDQSGIWKNGDTGYAGWVGGCSEQYSTCSEFDDVLDVTDGSMYGTEDGAAYYYLDNESLEDSNLATSQKCDGQVSQKQGCALFVNTTDYSRTSNASATYVASTHADALFGDAPFALVEPIDCDSGQGEVTATDGTVIDLCTNRCLYDNADVYDLGGDYDDVYTYGASCYTADDCAGVTSESGETVSATCDDVYTDGSGASFDVPTLENDTNRVLKVNRDRECSEWLSCSDTQTVWDAVSGSYKTVCGDVSLCNEYSSTGNASFCSSWSDDSTAAILDADRYTARDVSWYGNDYSGYAIPNTYPVELLQQSNVAAPSGYCDLTHATDVEGNAYDYTTSEMHGIACTEFDNCNISTVVGEECVTSDTPTYDLIYNAGSCDEAYGVSCTVGYCQETGESCASNDECGTGEGSCVVGTCYDVVPDSTCSVDSDCSGSGSGFSCVSGTCADELGDLDVYYDECNNGFTGAVTDHPLGDYDATVGTLALYDSVLTKAGTCVREQCLLTSAGTPYDVTAIGSKECRGYPESDSPFANEVVSEWKNPDPAVAGDDAAVGMQTIVTDISTDADGDGVADNVETAPDFEPYNFVTGFENVQTCQAGEDCVCSYDKVTYGAGDVRYYEDGSEYPDPDNVQFGICVGGMYDGAYCSTGGSGTASILETSCESNDGVCSYATRKDSVTGLDGYCLERDTSININGNRDADHRACITWLPVDQLVGSTDIYAKFLTAGYFDESYVCTSTKPYADVLTSPNVDMDSAPFENGDIACAEAAADFAHTTGLDCNAIDGSENDGAEWDVSAEDSYCQALFYNTNDGAGADGCAVAAECPEGFWKLIGQPTSDAEDETLAGACDGDGAAEVADCPYACIPFGSFIDADPAKSCEPTGSYVQTLLDTNTNDGWDYTTAIPDSYNAYIVAQNVSGETDPDISDLGELQFDNMYKALKDCRAIGLEYTDDFVSGDGPTSDNPGVLDFPASTGIAQGVTGGSCQYDTEAKISCASSGDCGTAGICSSKGRCSAAGTCSSSSECGSGECVDGGVLGNSYANGYRYYETQWDTYAACKETTQVAGEVTSSSGDSVFKSYVWTDRVLGVGHTVTGATSTGLAYTKTDVPVYYGMTVSMPSDREEIDPPFQVAVCKDNDSASADYLNIYLPDDPNACPTDYTSKTRSDDDRAEDPSAAETRSWIDFTQKQPDSYSSTGGNRDYGDIWSVADDDTFGARINQVFAFLGFGSQHTWEGDQTAATGGSDVLKYGAATDAEDDTTLSAYDTRTSGNPPTVWALDTANCEGDACEEGEENSLTVNADSSGDQTSADFFRTYLKFYAAADKNQLPIRRVIVDWQDDLAGDDLTGSDSDDNFYKNHRGLQDDSAASKCDAGSSEWGLTADSCESDYFSYSHIYTCTAGTINTLENAGATCSFDTDGNATNSPCVSDDSCYFRPRVHIRDNWGWCSGTCTAGDDGDEGCYEGSTIVGGVSRPANFMDSDGPYSECSYQAYPDGDSAYDNDPWVYYDGNIVVTP